jgi:hypothetical protein
MLTLFSTGKLRKFHGSLWVRDLRYGTEEKESSLSGFMIIVIFNALLKTSYSDACYVEEQSNT